MVQRIKALCKEKGITVAELERRCSIGNGIIARWKTSKPSYERLSVVAKKLDTTVEYLLTGEEQKESPPQGGEPPTIEDWEKALEGKSKKELKEIIDIAMKKFMEQQ